MADLNNSAFICSFNDFIDKTEFKVLDLGVLNVSRNTTDKIIVFNSIVDNKTSVDENIQSILVENVGVSTDVIVTLYIAFLLCFELKLPYIRVQDVNINELINKKNLKRITALLFLTAISPLLILLLIICLLYKSICRSIIMRQDKLFVNYLDSFDVFWSLDDNTSKSIINVLGVVEAKSAVELADVIKQKLLNAGPNSATENIFYRRNEKFGFYYWRKCEVVDIDQYIKVLDHKGNTEYLNDTDLEEIMELVNNGMLPYANEGLFQILITNPRLCANDNFSEYGIIFRIHHAVGDGVSLIKFLCKSFTKNTDCKVKLFSDSKRARSNKCSPKDLIDMMKTLSELPQCFVDGIVRESDNNILHGPKLCGNKIFKWTNGDEMLLQHVKDIKDNVDGMKFTDVLMAALATSLRNFFRQKSSCTPEELAVVLPIRFAQPTEHEEDFKLDNDFSVTILDLPITGDGLREIQLRCNAIRKSADPITNYYFLKMVGAILPKPLLHPLLTSSQATMIFSNMPGPDTLHICEGSELKKLVFFVPHKGTTGLGITALSYGGVLRFGAMADKALISNREDLALILTGMETEIRRLHQEVKGGRRLEGIMWK